MPRAKTKISRAGVIVTTNPMATGDRQCRPTAMLLAYEFLEDLIKRLSPLS